MPVLISESPLGGHPCWSGERSDDEPDEGWGPDSDGAHAPHSRRQAREGTAGHSLESNVLASPPASPPLTRPALAEDTRQEQWQVPVHTGVSASVQDQASPAPPPTSHLHTQASSPRTIYTPEGHRDPCTVLAPGRLSLGLQWAPAPCYRRADSADKVSLLGPTNGVILGTTQKDRRGRGLGSPVILSFISTLSEGRTKTSARLGGWRSPVQPEGRSPGRWLGRSVLRVTVPPPLGRPTPSLPTTHGPRCGVRWRVRAVAVQLCPQRGVGRRLLKPPKIERSWVWIHLQRVRAQTCNFSAGVSGCNHFYSAFYNLTKLDVHHRGSSARAGASEQRAANVGSPQPLSLPARTRPSPPHPDTHGLSLWP